MTGKASLFARAAAAAVLLLSILSAVAWAADILCVTEREAAIRRDKKTYSPKVDTLKEGDKVVLLETAEPWIRVSFEKKDHTKVEGWLNQTSVTPEKQFVPSTSLAATEVKASEQSSGGRGFDKMTENNYRKSKPELNAIFTLIDDIEKKKYPDEKILKFIESGKLTGGGE